MNDLHIGDFVITKDGDVGKVIHFNSSEVITDNGVFSPSEIDGHKSTLTELAREGDFINGAKISNRNGTLCVNSHPVKEDGILQFMTNKRFYRMCYSPVIKEDDEWKVISVLPMYEVSKNGVIRNTITGKYITNRINASKTTARLESGGGRHRLTYNVAELVLESFVEPGNGRSVIYKDGNPNNVSLDNLEWAEKQVVKEVEHKPIEKKVEKVKVEKKQDRLEGLSDEDFFRDMELLKKERFIRKLQAKMKNI